MRDLMHAGGLANLDPRYVYWGVSKTRAIAVAEGLDHPCCMTQRESEKIVRQECQQPWTVCRPAMVVGDSQTGEPTRSMAHLFFKLIQRMPKPMLSPEAIAMAQLMWGIHF